MPYIKKSLGYVSNATGCDSILDSDYVYILQRESLNGSLWEWRAKPYELVSSGEAELPVDGGLDLDVLEGPDFDIYRTETDLEPGGNSAIKSITSIDIDPSALKDLLFAGDTYPELGDSAAGRAYAVWTSGNNYAKVLIYKDGTQTKARWSTYALNAGAVQVGSGFKEPRDVVLSMEGGLLVAYISAVRKPTFSSPSTGVVYRLPRDPDTGMFPPVNDTSTSYIVKEWKLVLERPAHDNPQQLALHGGYVYVAHKSSIVRVNPVDSRSTVAYSDSELSGVTGLLLTQDGRRAYLTDAQEGGRLLSIDLDADGKGSNPRVLFTNLGGTGFLRWVDEKQEAFYLPLPDKNEVREVRGLDTDTPTSETKQSGAPATPRSVAVLSESSLFILGKEEYGTLDMQLAVDPGVLVLGIGLVPFDPFIKQPANPDDPDLSDPDIGKADTSGTDYFFQVNKVPFGGNLNLMLNHARARELGAKYYCVRAYQDGVLKPGISGGFTDFKWDISSAQWKEQATSSTRHNLDDLFEVRRDGDLWYNPYLGTILKSPRLNNGLVRLEMCFFNASKQEMSALRISKWVLIDNNRTSVKLSLPLVNGVAKTLHCGAMQYGNKDLDDLEFHYQVSHPTGNATFALSFQGGGQARPMLGMSGSVLAVSSPKVMKVRELIGNCNVANVYVRLSSTVRVTDGYRWIGSVSTARSFSLVPDGIQLDE